MVDQVDGKGQLELFLLFEIIHRFIYRMTGTRTYSRWEDGHHLARWLAGWLTNWLVVHGMDLHINGTLHSTTVGRWWVNFYHVV